MHVSYRAVGLLILLGIGGLAGCAGPERVAAPPPEAAKPAVKPAEARLRQAISEFYGAPYKYGGSTPAGVDCSGLVMRVYEQVGVKLPRTSEQQFHTGMKVDSGDLRYGDVLFFNKFCQRQYSHYAASILSIFSSEEDRPCHTGIYIGQGRFIHSSSSQRGVAVSNLNQDAWKRSLIGARRYLQKD